VAIARRCQAGRLWLLARELCASAALCRVEGSGSTASRTLRLAFTVLRERAEILRRPSAVAIDPRFCSVERCPR
jgi:hypothetical protein